MVVVENKNISRFNKIATHTTAHMAADKEAVGLSRVDMYMNTSVSLPYDDKCCYTNTSRTHTSS